MNPLERTCINRHGTWQYPSCYDPWYPWYPYWYHVTCGPDSTTTSTTSIDVNTCTSEKGDASTTAWN